MGNEQTNSVDIQGAGRLEINKDAFSSGQVGSKLWLCRELERHFDKSETVWIYGGWHGVMGLMLLSRDTDRLKSVRSFDVDPSCESIANALCENWVWRKWQFRAFTKDCNELDPAPLKTADGDFGPAPTVVINTAVEHFDKTDWFDKIPKGTLVALQAADFEHDGSVSPFRSEAALFEKYPLGEKLFSGSLKFDYGAWSFSRFMLIGRR